MSQATALSNDLAQDPSLASRDHLLDTRAMIPTLAMALGSDVSDVEILRVKYRIGDSLRVSYAVTSEHGKKRVSVRAFARPEAQRGLRNTSDATFQVREYGLAGWVYPADRRLSLLPSIEARPSEVFGPLGIVVDRAELVAFSPEKRATFRLTADGCTIAFAKLYSGSDSIASASVHAHIHTGLSDQALSVPEVLAVDHRVGLVVYSVVPGSCLADVESATTWKALGRASATLHCVEPQHDVGRFDRLDVDKLTAAADLVALARPDVADLANSLLHRLLATRTSDERLVTLHGDVHAKNAVVLGDRVGFIDLDQASPGPPAADLGSAIAAIEYGAVVDRTQRSCEVGALLDGYSEVSAVPDQADVNWHVAAALLAERCLRAVNRVRVDGLANLPDLLHVAHGHLGKVRR